MGPFGCQRHVSVASSLKKTDTRHTERMYIRVERLGKLSFGTARSRVAARPSPRYRFPMDDAVLKLVDDVLANAPAALREACSCRGILAGLETAGAFDVRTLRTLLEQDY